MGRETRKEVIRIRLSPWEKKRILENAAACGIPYSEYMRSVSLMGYRIKNRIESSRDIGDAQEITVDSVTLINDEAGKVQQKPRKHGTG